MTKTDYCDELTQTFPENLRGWLHTATQGIGRLGIARIVEDIRAHYDEAYRTAISDGLNNDAASSVALESLGDPKSARRRFRWRYLTQLQENRLILGLDGCLKSKSTSAFISIGGLLMLSLIAFERLIEGEAGSSLFLPIMFSFHFPVTMYFLHCYRAGRFRRTIIVECTFFLALFLSLVLMESDTLFRIPILILTALFCLWRYSIARKLPA